MIEYDRIRKTSWPLYPMVYILMFISYSSFFNLFVHPSKGFHADKNHVQVGTLLQRDLGSVAQFVAPQEASGTARAGCEQREGGKVMESQCDYHGFLVNIRKTMERSTRLLLGKSTISMAIFNSYVSLPEGNPIPNFHWKTPPIHGMECGNSLEKKHGFVERGCLIWTGDGITKILLKRMKKWRLLC